MLLFTLIALQIPQPNVERYHIDDLQWPKVALGEMFERHSFLQLGSDRDSFECKFKIQPFLQIAKDLQAMDEQQRIDTLHAWANIDQLSEAGVILCRMLIENKDGTPLRPPNVGCPVFVTEEIAIDCSNSPLLFFENVPFFVVRGYNLRGRAELATKYVQHACAVGKWRGMKYSTIPQKQLEKVARRLIKKYEGKARSPKLFAAWINSQL